jgi:hypothetical protein
MDMIGRIGTPPSLRAVQALDPYISQVANPTERKSWQKRKSPPISVPIPIWPPGTISDEHTRHLFTPSILHYFLFKLYVRLFSSCLIYSIFNVSRIHRSPFVNHHVVSSCTEAYSITDNPIIQCSTRATIPSLVVPNIPTTAATMPSKFDYSAWGEYDSIEKEAEF